jgi:hypothetical protein
MLLMLGLAFGLTACDDDDNDEPTAGDGNVTLEVRSTWQNQPVDASDTLALDGRALTLNKAGFVLSNFELIRDDGAVAQLDTFAFVDAIITEQGNVVSNPTQAFTLGSVPEGNYTGLRFHIGLDSVRNHDARVTDGFPNEPDHPMNRPDMHWGWNPQAGYKFINIQGAVDTTANGNGQAAGLIEFHVASDPLYREVMIQQEQAFQIGEEGATLPLRCALDRLFVDLDMTAATDRVTHTNDNPELANAVMQNLEASLSLE